MLSAHRLRHKEMAKEAEKPQKPVVKSDDSEKKKASKKKASQ